MSTSITFDTVQIQTSTYRPRFIQHEDIPTRNLFIYPIAREDGEVFVTELYGRKIIRIQGMLFGSSSADLDDKIDQFKELFSRREKNLDISWNNTTRRYVATCSKHNFNRDFYNINAVPWTAEFTVAQGMGIDTAITVGMLTHSLTTVSGQVSNYDYIANEVVTYSGSADPRPAITLTLSTAISGMCGIEYQNTDTGERLVITRAQDWSSLAGKQIVISNSGYGVFDNFNSTALVEGTFYGTFPRFGVGRNNLRIKTGGFTNQGTTDAINADVTLTSAQYQQISSILSYATSFTIPYSDSTFSGIMFCLANVGGVPSGDFTWQIVGDNAGVPDSGGTVFATGTLSRLLFPTAPTFRYIFAPSTVIFSLSANTRYWIIAKSSSNDTAKTAVRTDTYANFGYTPPQKSAYSSNATSFGPFYPGTISVGGSRQPWTNIANAAVEDGLVASQVNPVSTTVGDDLLASNFGMNIPEGAVPTTLLIEMKRNAVGTITGFNHQINFNGNALYKSNPAGVTPDGETWTTGALAWYQFNGGATDFGIALTRSVLNSATFQFLTDVAGNGTANVDSIRITVNVQTPLWIKEDKSMSFKLVFGGLPKTTTLTHGINYIKRWL